MSLSMVDRMHERRRHRALGLVIAAVFTLSGCAQEVSLPADADEELRTGADVYRARCASCHGADGGGGLGPTLAEIESRLDDEGQRSVVEDGRATMPGFANVLSESDLEAVVRYTREIL